MIAIGLLFLALCVALWARDTFIGKAFRAMLTDASHNAYGRMTPLRVVVGLIVFVGLIAFVIGAPEWIALFGLADLASYLDVGVILLLASTAAALRSPIARAVRFVRSRAARAVAPWHRFLARSRAPRRRKPKPPRPSEDDGGAEWEWAFA